MSGFYDQSIFMSIPSVIHQCLFACACSDTYMLSIFLLACLSLFSQVTPRVFTSPSNLMTSRQPHSLSFENGVYGATSASHHNPFYPRSLRLSCALTSEWWVSPCSPGAIGDEVVRTWPLPLTLCMQLGCLSTLHACTCRSVYVLVSLSLSLWVCDDFCSRPLGLANTAIFFPISGSITRATQSLVLLIYQMVWLNTIILISLSLSVASYL